MRNRFTNRNNNNGNKSAKNNNKKNNTKNKGRTNLELQQWLRMKQMSKSVDAKVLQEHAMDVIQEFGGVDTVVQFLTKHANGNECDTLYHSFRKLCLMATENVNKNTIQSNINSNDNDNENENEDEYDSLETGTEMETKTEVEMEMDTGTHSATADADTLRLLSLPNAILQYMSTFLRRTRMEVLKDVCVQLSLICLQQMVKCAISIKIHSAHLSCTAGNSAMAPMRARPYSSEFPLQSVYHLPDHNSKSLDMELRYPKTTRVAQILQPYAHKYKYPTGNTGTADNDNQPLIYVSHFNRLTLFDQKDSTQEIQQCSPKRYEVFHKKNVILINERQTHVIPQFKHINLKYFHSQTRTMFDVNDVLFSDGLSCQRMIGLVIESICFKFKTKKTEEDQNGNENENELAIDTDADIDGGLRDALLSALNNYDAYKYKTNNNNNNNNNSTKVTKRKKRKNKQTCQRCKGRGMLLLCDGCTASYHCGCAGLHTAPSAAQWFCPECVRLQQKYFIHECDLYRKSTVSKTDFLGKWRQLDIQRGMCAGSGYRTTNEKIYVFEIKNHNLDADNYSKTSTTDYGQQSWPFASFAKYIAYLRNEQQKKKRKLAKSIKTKKSKSVKKNTKREKFRSFYYDYM